MKSLRTFRPLISRRLKQANFGFALPHSESFKQKADKIALTFKIIVFHYFGPRLTIKGSKLSSIEVKSHRTGICFSELWCVNVCCYVVVTFFDLVVVQITVCRNLVLRGLVFHVLLPPLSHFKNKWQRSNLVPTAPLSTLGSPQPSCSKDG